MFLFFMVDYFWELLQHSCFKHVAKQSYTYQLFMIMRTLSLPGFLFLKVIRCNRTGVFDNACWKFIFIKAIIKRPLFQLVGMLSKTICVNLRNLWIKFFSFLCVSSVICVKNLIFSVFFVPFCGYSFLCVLCASVREFFGCGSAALWNAWLINYY